MKTFKQVIKQYAVLSLLVVYQLIGLIHIVYLPRLNDGNYLNSSSSYLDFLHKKNSTNAVRAQYQRSFYSEDKSSRKKSIIPLGSAIVFFAFVLTGIGALTYSKKFNLISATYFPAPPSYLSLRTLRV